MKYSTLLLFSLAFLLYLSALATALPTLRKRQTEGEESPSTSSDESTEDDSKTSSNTTTATTPKSSSPPVSTAPPSVLDPMLAQVPVPKRVDTASEEYSKLLSHSLLFYEAQRSGKLPEDNRVKWRHDSGLQDGADNKVDLMGGYYDAGDYVKVTLPLSFALNLINWGALEYFDGYVFANQTKYLREMVKWGTDWLIKAHPLPNVLYVQIGQGKVDNNYWGPDTNIPSPRFSFRIDINHTGTDVAAETAAAFASSSLLFRQLSRYSQNSEDFAYADQLLKHAIELYQFAQNSKPYNVYQKSVQEAKLLYPSSGYWDELAWASVWLYRATSEEVYLETAKTLASEHQKDLMTTEYPVDWDNKAGAFLVLASAVTSGYCPGGADWEPLPAKPEMFAAWRASAETYLDKVVDTQLGGSMTPGGLVWFEGTSNNNSLVASQNAAFLLHAYSSSVLRAMPEGKDQSQQLAMRAAKYESFALKQIDYLLGKNPLHKLYVVGEHYNSVDNPHHAGAHGGNDITNLMNPPNTAHVLYGAVVGGPEKDDSFTDDRRRWGETEVSLDYNAPYQSNIARMVMYGSDPFYITNTIPPVSPDQPSDTWIQRNLGWIIGVPVAVVVLLASGIGLLLWQRRRKTSRETRVQEFAAKVDDTVVEILPESSEPTSSRDTSKISFGMRPEHQDSENADLSTGSEAETLQEETTAPR
ncbi:uncharacterized protein VTP21DRAFT_11215 [Calcarisporiella thermophila]|uniref:uncharacterized protein n=1 Tax=Calcarisporiella thermophila TaxID=911321 RepID=UPI0037444F3A